MMRINLLPHRELKRKARMQQIAALAGITVVLGAIVVGVVHVAIITQIEHQNGRNKYMQDQIVILDKQIEEIKKIKEQTQALLARKKVVETLQGNRAEVVHVLDQLVRLLPDGVYIKTPPWSPRWGKARSRRGARRRLKYFLNYASLLKTAG